jgi:hypothetical protein
MINHFPNFVCWKEVFRVYDINRDLIYIDSFSCFVFGLVLGVRGQYFSGPQMAFRLSESSFEKCYFLLAEEINLIREGHKIVLAHKASFEGDKDLLGFLDTVPFGEFLIIGISSPKQNILANYLHNIRPDLEFFCLGAAVKQTWGFKYANTRLRGSGFQWLEFLLLQPRRTVGKLLETVVEAFSIIFSPKRMKSFRKFVEASQANKYQGGE